MLLLTAAQLRCVEPGVKDWRSVLLYGQRAAYLDYQIDGRNRHTLWLIYRKRLYAFIYRYPDEPGAIEPMKGGYAWHGCAVYEVAEFWP